MEACFFIIKYQNSQLFEKIQVRLNIQESLNFLGKAKDSISVTGVTDFVPHGNFD